MVKSLVNFLMTQHKHADLCADVNETLVKILDDPCVDVRLAAIQQVCGLAHAALCANAYSGEVGGTPGGENDGDGASAGPPSGGGVVQMNIIRLPRKGLIPNMKNRPFVVLRSAVQLYVHYCP